MKKYLFLLLIISGLLLTFCSGPKEGEVTLIHTNDMHSQYIPLTATWVDRSPQPQVGGMVALEYHIRQLREQWPNSLVIDAGDFLTGTPLAKVDVDGATGGAFVKMMNIIDYDVITVGNHEFDNGQDNLHKLLNMGNFDVVCCNMNIYGKPAVEKPYMIYKVDGVRVGVIGVMLKALDQVTAQKNLQGVEVIDPISITQKYIDEIDPKTDLIVLLTHNGIQEDMDLAKTVKNADLILGGHSHTRLPKPRKVNGMLVFQAGAKTTNLGRLTLDVKGDSIASYDYELLNTWVDSVKDPNPEMVKLVDTYKAEIDKEYNEQFGTLKTAWIRNNDGESNLGNFITDAIREESGADIAMMNSGGIRKDLPAGPITKLDIVEILPFTNVVETFECSGQDLITLINQNSGEMDGYRGVMQISGLHYTYRIKQDKSLDLVSAQVNGKPLDPKGTYTVATVDFILQGQAEKYLGFVPQSTTSTGTVVSDMVISYLKKYPEVDSKLEGRIKRVY